MADLRIEVVATVPAAELVDLYDAVGWTIYTARPERLAEAVAQSGHVAVVRDGGRLVGLVRGISDDVSVFYLQDLLVHPSWQGRGLGTALLKHIVERYAHVRQKVLLTDDEHRQHALYRSAGFDDVQEVSRLHAFVRFDTDDSSGRDETRS